jgi:hypothetical protein
MRATTTSNSPHPDTTSHWYRAGVAAAAVLALVATAVNGAVAARWIDTSFPGFFVLPNRVIPSAGLASWSGVRDGAVAGWTVTAIDGRTVASGGDVYRRVDRRSPGRTFTYTLRRGTETRTLALASQRFSAAEWVALFAPSLLSGLCYLLLGVLAAAVAPNARLGHALLTLGTLAGIHALSAVALCQPVATLRLHALAEAFLPAALVYLALVFPRERGWLTPSLGAVAWAISLALAVPYQLLIDQPSAYGVLHATCEIYLGLGAGALLATLVVEHARAGDAASALLRASVAGALLGLGVPAITALLSAVSGGALPVDAPTAFLFPTCCAFGLVRDRVRVRGAVAAPTIA